ncbi:hypothetical protein H9P43_009541 [Blastocladiella emersonii ATCC 22665]|nr:hypothetical protein H9P43_009541 [Blastocladiella emersonii ATCC 22665]
MTPDASTSDATEPVLQKDSVLVTAASTTPDPSPVVTTSVATGPVSSPIPAAPAPVVAAAASPAPALFTKRPPPRTHTPAQPLRAVRAPSAVARAEVKPEHLVLTSTYEIRRLERVTRDLAAHLNFGAMPAQRGNVRELVDRLEAMVPLVTSKKYDRYLERGMPYYLTPEFHEFARIKDNVIGKLGKQVAELQKVNEMYVTRNEAIQNILAAAAGAGVVKPTAGAAPRATAAVPGLPVKASPPSAAAPAAAAVTTAATSAKAMAITPPATTSVAPVVSSAPGLRCTASNTNLPIAKPSDPAKDVPETPSSPASSLAAAKSPPPSTAAPVATTVTMAATSGTVTKTPAQVMTPPATTSVVPMASGHPALSRSASNTSLPLAKTSDPAQDVRATPVSPTSSLPATTNGSSTSIDRAPTVSVSAVTSTPGYVTTATGAAGASAAQSNDKVRNRVSTTPKSSAAAATTSTAADTGVNLEWLAMEWGLKL